jgi:phosphoribosyl-AMP cyclohydrolase
MTKVLIPNFEKRGNGLVRVVVQDLYSGETLIVASTDLAGYLETLQTGELVLFSESRNKRWKKGEESGHVMKVHDIRIDCDGDALTVKVTQKVPCACHTGARTCFFRNIFVNDDLITPAPKAGEKEKLSELEVEVHPSLLVGGR